MTILGQPTPILRIFDVAKAQEFYIDYLGFNIDWQHRFEEKLPLYMSISRDNCTLHLTEHHGDCCPGAAMRVPVGDVVAFHNEIAAKDYDYLRPGIETTPWDTREVTVKDPFFNRLTFYEALTEKQKDTEILSV